MREPSYEPPPLIAVQAGNQVQPPPSVDDGYHAGVEYFHGFGHDYVNLPAAATGSQVVQTSAGVAGAIDQSRLHYKGAPGMSTATGTKRKNDEEQGGGRKVSRTNFATGGRGGKWQ